MEETTDNLKLTNREIGKYLVSFYFVLLAGLGIQGFSKPVCKITNTEPAKTESCVSELTDLGAKVTIVGAILCLSGISASRKVELKYKILTGKDLSEEEDG